MGKGLDWYLTFQDKISGPARKMLGAVDELDDRMRRLGVTTEEVGKADNLVEYLSHLERLDKYLDGFRTKASRATAAFAKLKGPDLANASMVSLDNLLKGEPTQLGDRLREYREAGNGLNHTARGRGGRKAGMGVRDVETNFAKLIQSVAGSSPDAASGLLNAGRGLVEVDSKLQALGLSLEGVVAGFAAAGAAAAAFVAVSATAILLKGSSMVIDAVAFKENSLAAFKLITKTDMGAQEAYRTALETADLLGVNRRETLTSFQQLLSKGFDLDTITKLTKGMADLQAINPTANIQSLTLAISQIRGKGKLQGEELMQLAEAGLSQASVMEALAQATGKSIDEVDKMLKAGKIDATQGVDAILASIKKLTGGELGEAAIQKASTISGLLKQLSWENLQDRLFLDVDIGPGFDAFKGFLKNLNNLLNANSEAGKRLRSVIGSSFGGLFATVFGDLSGEDGAKTLEATILKIVGLVESVLAGVTGFFSGFGSALVDGLGLGAKAFSEMSAPERQAALERISEQFSKIGSALGALVVFGVAVINMFVGLGEAASVAWDFLSPLSAFGDMLDSLVSAFSGKGAALGRAIVDGMTGGIYGLLSRLFGAGSAMGTAVEDGARTTTKTHSPSQLFDELGGDLVDGLTNRLNTDKGPEMAAAAMIGSPADLAQDARQAGTRMGRSAAGGAGGRDTYHIVINAPSGRAEDIREAVADLFDDLRASAA